MDICEAQLDVDIELLESEEDATEFASRLSHESHDEEDDETQSR